MTGCLRHFAIRRRLFRKARQWGIPLRAKDIKTIEAALEKMRSVFITPGMNIYSIRVRRHNDKIFVKYDARLRCLVSVWRYD